jgi:Toxin SymE, type I toxin-antitoxin system
LEEATMPEIMKSRRSTVYGTSPALRTAQVSYTRGPAPLPALRLKGRWLAQAGFDIGTRIEVIVTEGELVLRVLPAENDASPAARVEAGDICRGAYL